MGIADRDYYRSSSPEPSTLSEGLGRGRAAIGFMSVNTWLILLCIAVFVIDSRLPIVDVPTTRVQWYNPEAQHLDRSMVVMGSQYANNGTEVWRSLHERGQPAVIGWAEVHRMHWLTAYLHFSTRLAGFEFWRFLGFQFLHFNLTHLLFNMIGLFFFGPIVEEALGRKRYLAFYLLCGCCGALLYLILNGIGAAVNARFGTVGIPGLLFSDPSTPLVGASAGIFGVIMAGAFIAPNAQAVYLFIPMRLRTLAYGLVALAFFMVVTGGGNAGGEAAHLGGAIAGYYFIRHPHHLHNFFDILGRADPTSHHYRGTESKAASVTRTRTAASGGAGGGADPREVDRILDKIHREGLPSLTDAEKRTLAAGHET